MRVSVFGLLENRRGLPEELSGSIEGYSFRARANRSPVLLQVEGIGRKGQLLHRQSFEIGPEMTTYEAAFAAGELAEIRFVLNGQTGTGYSSGTIILDEIHLLDGSNEPFIPPTDDLEMLKWLKESGLRYFVWNYRDSAANDGGVVLKEGRGDAFVSVSGLGMALAIYAIAEEDGFVTSDVAEERTLAILRFLQDQNWFDGSSGWHGFPYHYFAPDGTPQWPRVSTIDWAMCAAGIRTARQKYNDNREIVTIAGELLGRAKWNRAIDDDGKIVMGFEPEQGEANTYRWGLSFSEETELVYLEAVASGKLSATVFNSITRRKQGIFYPSWFGTGFVYNWMQLWTGPLLPYARNSRRAYLYDAKTSETVFGIPIMGLTAAGTFTELDNDGFTAGRQYFSNQGSEAHATTNADEVVRVAPAPYGAVLALPYAPDEALGALRQFVKLGYYHPYLGLPDTVRLAGLPKKMEATPSWLHFDLNIGAQTMAIDQFTSNTVGHLYRSDPQIDAALYELTQSVRFEFD